MLQFKKLAAVAMMVTAVTVPASVFAQCQDDKCIADCAATSQDSSSFQACYGACMTGVGPDDGCMATHG